MKLRQFVRFGTVFIIDEHHYVAVGYENGMVIALDFNGQMWTINPEETFSFFHAPDVMLCQSDKCLGTCREGDIVTLGSKPHSIVQVGENRTSLIKLGNAAESVFSLPNDTLVD